MLLFLPPENKTTGCNYYMSKNLAQKLNEILEKSELTYSEIEKKTNGVVKASYLSSLRSGRKSDPSNTVITALASVFEVSPSYFLDTSQLSYQASLLATRAMQLDTQSQEALLNMADHLLSIYGNKQND